MFDEKEGPIEQLVHLYVDGAFSRRELIRRVAKHTGTIAAAVTALGSFEMLQAQNPTSCPVTASVAADRLDLNVSDIQFPGEAGTVFGHLAFPAATDKPKLPAILVIHENRGLVEHIKDVTRRAANAGFVTLGVDLLSRQGGTSRFPDATQQAQAYGRTVAAERLADMISAINYLKSLDYVQNDKIGAVGFCAGGGNVWNLAVNLPELTAGVAFYGTPLPPVDQITQIKAAMLGIYAEQDRALTLQTTPIITSLINQRVTFGFHIYQGVGHAFHNDTGPAYNADAACDAWSRTLAWFTKFLGAPTSRPPLPIVG